ncbi:hypothetical protein G9A89_013664 [Geosiphon pyriformis]|nr:hypothetical protein G9A89_013664 [Geosiphon pyriformis]
MYLQVCRLLKYFGIMFADQLLNSYGECFDWKNFRRWKHLDSKGPVLLWFTLVSGFVKDGNLVKNAFPTVESPLKLDVLNTDHFSFVYSSLKDAFLPVILVYTDGSVKNFGTSDAVKGAAAYFSDLSLHVGVEVHGLLSSTLAEMQAIALALECVPAFSDVIVFSDSQAFLDACQAELSLAKVKSYSGVLGNEHADCLADTAMSSELFFPANIKENFLLANGRVISGKARHFIRIVNDTIRRFQWKFGLGLSVVDSSQIGDINWFCTALGLVLDNWLTETKTFFVDSKLAMFSLVEFVWSLQCGLLGVDGSLCNVVWGLPVRISGGVAHLLEVGRGHVVSFGLSSSCLFFISVAGEVMVNIVA